jgi:hypothetical protein
MIIGFKELFLFDFLFGVVRQVGKQLNFNMENETLIALSTGLIIIISIFVLYSIYRVIKDVTKNKKSE